MTIRYVKPQKPEDMLLRLIRIAEILVKGESEENPISPSIDMLDKDAFTVSAGSEKHKYDVLM